MSVSLRPATQADYEFLWQLHRDTMREYVDRTWGWNEQAQAAMFRERFDPGKTEIIELAGEPIGSWTVAREHDRFRLQQIEIAPSRQSHSIGTQLIRNLLREADAAHVPVELQVLTVNPARRLYERLGFSVVEETPPHQKMRRRAPNHGRRIKT